MKNLVFGARPHIGGVVLCALVTFGLAACGADQGSSASAAASVSANPLVSPNVGVIDRSPVAGNTAQGTAPASSNTTPTSSGTAPGSGSTTVAAIDKGSGSVAFTPPPKPVSPPPKPSTGTATLDWTPPTQNSDGSVLTNLAGYTVYYGTSPDSLTQSVKVSNPGLTAYTLSNLQAGTWYFAVTSYSSAGVESTRSGVISAKI
ncbi:MAG: sericin-like [Gammaproteobacteria bacterium]|nr:sericin-like [Gammaproteobacteria bacterium]